MNFTESVKRTKKGVMRGERLRHEVVDMLYEETMRVSETWEEFRDISIAVTQETCGMRKKGVRKSGMAWQNKDIKRAIKENQVLYQMMDDTPCRNLKSVREQHVILNGK